MMKNRKKRARQLVGLCLGLPPEELEADIRILMGLLQLRMETSTTIVSTELRVYEHPKTADQLALERRPQLTLMRKPVSD